VFERVKMGIVEFLRARIAEDESCVAPEAREPDPVPRWGWDRARVLAECVAKRQIVTLHRLETVGEEPWELTGCPLCDHDCDAGGDLIGDGPCETLLALALPYAGHPHYDPEWIPVDRPVRSRLGRT
jgi:hypothetical protein